MFFIQRSRIIFLSFKPQTCQSDPRLPPAGCLPAEIRNDLYTAWNSLLFLPAPHYDSITGTKSVTILYHCQIRLRSAICITFRGAGHEISQRENKKGDALSYGISRLFKADDGNRTRLPSLGSWCSTDELHLHSAHVKLYPS